MTDIHTHEDSGVLVITFNREAKKNAITVAMYQTLSETLQRAADDPRIAVVLFHGSEQAFSAGNDLGDFLSQPPDSLDAPVWQFLRTLAAFPKPLVAAVCGVAVGIGTTLLLHCDLVHAGSNARFSLPFVNLGLCPEAGSSLLLPRLFGYQRAAEALLLGDPFDAETAARAGLVSKVLEPSQVLQSALTQARKLASKPLQALIETKRLLKNDDVVVRIDEEARVFMRMLESDVAREAIAGFRGK
ncbi:enoyl-CoA hydratase [Pseudomonas japonica]|uniref:Enoyl-CoA hydratase/carnithine racemase n=1 Tax=Pseudomonas japonica TaxID=256466 RepID=A0A239I376_9PSED|nr:enoyl-CoA hydratase [Pseudomonas japonica]SNS87832.1 Enoyl-CoA hydratase/carnithine racemase [Pseudomonas japonica]